jgi:hypothetical protein
MFFGEFDRVVNKSGRYRFDKIVSSYIFSREFWVIKKFTPQEKSRHLFVQPLAAVSRLVIEAVLILVFLAYGSIWFTSFRAILVLLYYEQLGIASCVPLIVFPVNCDSFSRFLRDNSLKPRSYHFLKIYRI